MDGDDPMRMGDEDVGDEEDMGGGDEVFSFVLSFGVV